MSKKRIKIPVYGGFVFLLFLIPLFVTNSYYVHVLIMGLVAVILSSSLRLTAMSGQLSLAHGGMMSLGAYTSALLVMKLGLSSWLALIAGGMVAIIVASIVVYPFVRVKGVYFVMLTAFLGEVIRLVAEQWKSLTGGASGITGIPRPASINIASLFSIDFSSKIHYYYLALILTLCTLLVLYAIEKSRIGTILNSIAQNDSLAESAGINTMWFKASAFCINCFFAGVAGAFYSQYVRAIAPSSFGFIFTIYVVIYMTVGGVRKFAGPIIGALLLTFIPEALRELREYQPIIFGVVLILTVFFLPDGLISIPQKLREFYIKGSQCLKSRD